MPKAGRTRRLISIAPLVAWLLAIFLVVGLFGLKISWIQRGNAGGILAILSLICSLSGMIGGGIFAAKERKTGWVLISLASVAALFFVYFAMMGFAMGNMH